MKTRIIILTAVPLSFLLLSGCCTTKTVISADGNTATGVVGGSIAVTACTPMEKEVANELAQLSDWYRTHWDNCSTNSDPAACRADISKAYQEQQKLLLDVLASMNGRPKAEQEQIYRQMHLKNPTLFK
ncbi:MAG TPA: hypothetical protein VMA13_01685 [Candidatus Saccharimonadales bacterium]|nr:hypothetical protein [Candidatus Saccharimonadales bacterium]